MNPNRPRPPDGTAGVPRPAAVAVLGLGEAGRRYAAGLIAAGHRVSGYDPAPGTPDVPGIHRARTAGEAVDGADLVLGLTGAAHSLAAAEQCARALGPDACFADLNSSAPSGKREVARALRASGVLVADVAVLAPVPRAGAATPLLACGPGAAVVAGVMRGVGADVEVLDEEPVGAAAGRKLLRSVFMKGLAAAVDEAVSAGALAGCEEWVREQIAAELGPGGAESVERMITGSRTHAARRVHEVRASRDHLAGLGAHTPVCDATLEWLLRLTAEQDGQDKGKGGHAA